MREKKRTKRKQKVSRDWTKLKLVVCGALVLAILLTAVLAPYITPYDPYEQDLGRALLAPCREHLFRGKTPLQARRDIQSIQSRLGEQRTRTAEGVNKIPVGTHTSQLDHCGSQRPERRTFRSSGGSGSDILA